MFFVSFLGGGGLDEAEGCAINFRPPPPLAAPDMFNRK